MSTIAMNYALENYNMGTFMQVSPSVFYDIKNIKRDIDNIKQECFSPSFDINYEIFKKNQELESLFARSKKDYQIKLQQLNNLKQKHIGVLIRGSVLEDEEYHAFSWLFSRNGREKAIAKHHERYRNVYDQISSLEGEVYRLEPYNEQNRYETRQKVLCALKEQLEYRLESEAGTWNAQQERKLRLLRTKLSALSKNFYYLIQDLQIFIAIPEVHINGQFYTINGDAKPLFLNQTLVNKSVEIIR